jgi:cell division protein FtsN
MRFFPCAAALLALCLTVREGYGLDLTLQEVRLDLMAADTAGAARMYAHWLDVNHGSPAAPLMFQRYFDTEPSLPALLENARKFLTTSQKGAFLPESMMRVARLFDVAGLTEEARDAYLAALARGAPDSALESSFLLSLEMNDTGALQAALAGLKDDEGERARFLKACIAYQKGDTGPASEALMHIAEGSADQSVALKALWLRYQIAVRAGDSAARQEAAKLLQVRFPRSPEGVMAAADDPTSSARAPADVTLMAKPSSFLGNEPAPLPASRPAAGPEQDAAPSAAQPADSPAPSPATAIPLPPGNVGKPAPRTLSVQAGSFQMKENADDLISGLVKNGFEPTLRSDAAQGKILYRVFVGRGLTAEEAHSLLDKLHQAGFSGFLTSDP